MNIRNKQKLENKYSGMTDLRNFFITVKDNSGKADAFSLLIWFAVRDPVDDILEHLDTVQVSSKTRIIGFIKISLVKDIHTYVSTIFALC